MMDLLSNKWLSEMEMNDSPFNNHQWQHMSPLQNESFDFKPFPSSNNITTYDYTNNINNNCVSQISNASWEDGGVVAKSSSNKSTASSTIISFGNSASPPITEKKKCSSSSTLFPHHQISNLEDIYAPLEYGEMKRGVVSRTPEQAQDHVLAERKRREKMTQKFVALSTLIPGLKKLDKATVLGDAINYIKELQERVKELEVEVKGKPNEEAITVGAKKRPRFVSSYDNNEALSSCDENLDGGCSSSIVVGMSNNHHQMILPEIEVRASEGNIMVRVYCKNQTGVIKEVMGEIDNHNLSMISSSVMPFGDNRLHMTIIAQMDGESELTPKDLTDNLQTAIQNLV